MGQSGLRAQVGDSSDFAFVAALLQLFTHLKNEAILSKNMSNKASGLFI